MSFFFVDRHGDCFPCGYRGGENLGAFGTIEARAFETKPHCRACDWECFRDPGELLGPLGDLAGGPAGWRNLWRADRTQLRLWLEDLRYFAGCDQFNGRLPPRARVTPHDRWGFRRPGGALPLLDHPAGGNHSPRTP